MKCHFVNLLRQKKNILRFDYICLIGLGLVFFNFFLNEVIVAYNHSTFILIWICEWFQLGAWILSSNSSLYMAVKNEINTPLDPPVKLMVVVSWMCAHQTLFCFVQIIYFFITHPLPCLLNPNIRVCFNL